MNKASLLFEVEYYLERYYNLDVSVEGGATAQWVRVGCKDSDWHFSPDDTWWGCDVNCDQEVIPTNLTPDTAPDEVAKTIYNELKIRELI